MSPATAARLRVQVEGVRALRARWAAARRLSMHAPADAALADAARAAEAALIIGLLDEHDVLVAALVEHDNTPNPTIALGEAQVEIARLRARLGMRAGTPLADLLDEHEPTEG